MSPSSLLGSAGEHYLMSLLLRQQFIAALAPVGVPTADIIVTDDAGERASAIQVKTRRDIGSDGGWHMKAKHETIVGPSLFYAFISFGSDETRLPDVFIVPSGIVADAVTRSYRHWLTTPGRAGQTRKDGVMRRFLPDYSRRGLGATHGAGWLEPYRDAWDQLRATV